MAQYETWGLDHLQAIKPVKKQTWSCSRSNSDVNKTDDEGITALSYPIQESNKESVVFTGFLGASILVGADANRTDNKGKTALFYAVEQSNNESVVRALITAGADVNITDNEGKTALFYAVKKWKNESVVCALIDAGVDVNKSDNKGQTALYYAVEYGNKSVVCALIGSGADVNRTDKGKTALFYAVKYGNKSVVYALIDAGADVNRTDNEGKSALFYAVQKFDHENVVCALIDAGADVNRTDNEGKTALFYAVEQSNNERVVHALIDAGADVNITDNEGKTALFYAVPQSNNEHVVHALIDGGADVNRTDNEGKTALFYAVQQRNNESVLCALLNAGDYVNTADNEGKTALFYAVEYGNDKMVHLLIKKGNAFTSSKDNYGRTPLFYAMTKSLTLIGYLLDKGASMYSIDNCKISILTFFIDKCMVDKNDLFFQLERINMLIKRGMNRKKIFETIISVIFCKYFLLLTSKTDFETFNVVLELANTYADERDKQTVGNISQRMRETISDRSSHGTVILEILDLLFELGADPNSADSDGNTALHYAACLPFHGISEKTTLELLNKLENTGAMIDARNHKQETPLLYCLSCFCGLASKTDKPINILVGVCTFFLKYGSDIRKTTQSGKSVFHFVIEGFQQVLNWHDISKEKDAFQEGIKLLQVLSSGNEATCKIHVAVNNRNYNFNSPLHLWASLEPVYQCFNQCAFKMFLKAILRHLLSCGVILDDRNISDQTPLHLCRTWTAVQLLLDAGANPNVVDSSGCTPLLVAARNKTFLQRPGYFYPDVHQESKAFWKTVLERKLDPWKVDIHGQSVLDILMGSKAIDLAKGLIEVSCDESYLQSHKIVILLLNSLCRDNSMNAQWKSKYVETILKSTKCSVSGSTQEDSPLHLCFKNIIRASKVLSVNEVKMTVHWTIARQLISYGADPRISVAKGQSCLDIAKEYPPLNELCTSVNIPLYIPWTSVSKLHKYKLVKVARRQESKHVYSFWYHMEPLAQGSFGAVFVGISENDGREVAIKRIEKLRMLRPEDKREVTNLTALVDCEQVTHYLCFFEDEDFSYVVLELMEGNLNEILTQKTTVDAREKFCQDVVKGLRYLHGLYILHRDLKPTNILFKTHPKLCLKIADFGLSNQIDNTGSTTVFGTNVGTRCWIAPEVLESTKPHSRSSDVFACGLVLHYILSLKKHPFAPADDTKRSMVHVTQTENNIILNEMKGWDDSLCPEATQLLKAMLDSDDSKRPTAAEALDHPFFWTKKKKMYLLIAVGNQPEFEYSRSGKLTILNAVESDLETTFGTVVQYGKWNAPGYKNMPAIYAEMTKKRRQPYDTHSVVELVRFIRNAAAHVSESTRPTQIRKQVLNDFVFLEYFPNLVMEVYKVVTTHRWDQTREEIKYSLYG